MIYVTLFSSLRAETTPALPAFESPVKTGVVVPSSLPWKVMLRIRLSNIVCSLFTRVRNSISAVCSIIYLKSLRASYITNYCDSYNMILAIYHIFCHMMTSSNGNIFRVTVPLCGEFTGEFPSQRPVTRSFDVSFDLRLNQRLSKQWRRR